MQDYGFLVKKRKKNGTVIPISTFRRCTAAAIVLISCFPLFACQSVTEETLRAGVLDAAINAAVKSRILVHPFVRSAEVSVETVRGRVYLRGIVYNSDDKRRAEELANTVPWAVTVVNKLEVQETRNL